MFSFLSILVLSVVAVPQAPVIVSPTAGQVNVNEHASFSWSDTQGEPVSYQLYISTVSPCHPSTASKTFSTGFKSFTLPEGVNLAGGTSFYACVKAVGASGESPLSASQSFSTRGVTVQTPEISTDARSSVQTPSGQRQILISGINGEEGALVKVFLKTSSADIQVGSSSIDGNAAGSFTVSVNVLSPSAEAGLRTYYALIERPISAQNAQKVVSAASNLLNFYYDSRFALGSPQILKEAGLFPGTFKWSPLSGVSGVSYEIYRRNEKASCTPSATVTCYLNKPFTKISTLTTPSAGSDGFIHYSDISLPLGNDGATYTMPNAGVLQLSGQANTDYVIQAADSLGQAFKNLSVVRSDAQGKATYADPANGQFPSRFYRIARLYIGDEGFSYFIVATRSNGDRSNRSNALSFVDFRVPQRSAGESVQVISSKTGRSIQIYYCNIDSGGFLNADNSPDLTAKIQYFQKPANAGCQVSNADYERNSIDPQLNGGRQDLAFDQLAGFSDLSLNIQNCVLAGEISNLDPDTPYCFQSCLQDQYGRDANQKEATCSNLDQRTLPDLVSPTFTGSTQAVPQNDGRSIQVFWDLAREDQTTREVIQYQIQKTGAFDSNGNPIFKDILNDPDVLVVGGGVNNASIGNLDTGAKYCFLVSALDNSTPANRNTPADHYQCATSLDNRPSVQNISIGRAPLDAPYKVPILFQIVDREADLAGHTLSLDGISYRINGGDWRQVAAEHLSGDASKLKASTSINSAPVNSVVFDTLPYFSGEQTIEFKIRVSDSAKSSELGGTTIVNTSESQSSSSTVFRGMATIGAFQDASLTGCELKMDGGNSRDAWFFSALGLFSLFLLFVQRRNFAVQTLKKLRRH